MTSSNLSSDKIQATHKGPRDCIKVAVERQLIQIGVVGANALYRILKLLPVQQKVTFLTWNSDVTPPDFQVLIDKLKFLPNSPTIVTLCRELRGGMFERFIYVFHMIHQAYEMATSKVIVLDAYCPMASILHHRSELGIVQIWHALGAFKKFGWSIVDKSEGWSAQSNIPSRTLSRLLRMHAGYTDAIVSYSGAIPHFAEAFRCDLSILHVAWLPRVEMLRNKKKMTDLRQRILNAHPELRGRRIALYAPTIRRPILNKPSVSSLVQTIHANDWALIVKPHPLRGEKPRPIFPDLTIPVPDYSAMELLAVADAVITDYSAIVYEAYLREIPVYFFADDLDTYEETRGFYTHPNQFPSKMYTAAENLVLDMNTGVVDRDAMRAFVDLFVEDSPARIDILDLIVPYLSLDPNEKKMSLENSREEYAKK